MTRIAPIALALGMLFSVPMFAGCDKELKHDETTKTAPNGDTVHEDKTVKRTPNGDVVTEQHKTVDNTHNP